MKCEEIGSRLRKIRKESGMRLCDASHSSGYSEVHLCEMERNNKMSISSLCNVLETYGYEIEFAKIEMGMINDKTLKNLAEIVEDSDICPLGEVECLHDCRKCFVFYMEKYKEKIKTDAIDECIEALGNNIWDIAKLEQLKEQK